ncbi:hypothetical protein [Mesorhizobium sp. B2-8-9]|uniref:hypothetical protein n=1 Tax=Mesorhizobium sp. B2-8-9 TaxID=2589899 RepID=UPI001125E25F|nr:hypothetical protein [Mesorhizobium sp. B2-8-9]TPI71803.1 hypothetical protein FJ423_28595 [Mesorhizobium sp. B2-8-9]
MTLQEKRFWNAGLRGGGREVYALGIDTETWELKVRYLKFWRGDLKEFAIFSIARFFERVGDPGPKNILRKELEKLPAIIGLEAARDSV